MGGLRVSVSFTCQRVRSGMSVNLAFDMDLHFRWKGCPRAPEALRRLKIARTIHMLSTLATTITNHR